MDSPVITISTRGQITIPKKARSKLKAKYLTWRVEDAKLILEPLQSREDFLRELEAAERDWGKNGGTSLDEVIRQSRRLP